MTVFNVSFKFQTLVSFQMVF